MTTVLSVDNARTGDVWITDFDRGVVETFGAIKDTVGDTYVIPEVFSVAPPPDPRSQNRESFEGIPVYFAFPGERIDNKILPSFIIRRDAVNPAMSRWHLGASQYVIPADGSNQVTVLNPRTGAVIATGPDEVEVKDQAVPFDILYTIQIRARYRNNLKVEAMEMLRYTMRRYQTYTTVYLRDSLGEIRSYTAFNESISPQDTLPDIDGREMNFNVSLRVEAELDLNDPFVKKTLSGLPVINTSIL